MSESGGVRESEPWLAGLAFSSHDVVARRRRCPLCHGRCQGTRKGGGSRRGLDEGPAFCLNNSDHPGGSGINVGIHSISSLLDGLGLDMILVSISRRLVRLTAVASTFKWRSQPAYLEVIPWGFVRAWI